MNEVNEESLTQCKGCNQKIPVKRLVHHLIKTKLSCKSAYGDGFLYKNIIQCDGCNQTLPLKSLVHHLTKTKKPCKSAYPQEFIDDWKEICTVESKKLYKRKNMKMIAMGKAQYYEKNKEKIKEKSKRMYQEKGKRRYQEKKAEEKKREAEKKLEYDQRHAETDKRQDNLRRKRAAEQYLEKVIQIIKESSNFCPEFTEVRNLIEETFKKIEKEIDMCAQKLAEANLVGKRAFNEVKVNCNGQQ